ncbi:MAG: hypothetical protein AUI14_10750 [Actinobacteria bacterium 13_2_20CM_2_71_6]|nr:MAG: hypothetical protein AUI14_10750 [Actinobacteria bacterium 13_2_20CM_2_71_6]
MVTPVWVVRDGAGLASWTNRRTAKVKRIRRDVRVTVAPCTFRGQLLGEPVPGRAELMDAEGTARVERLLSRKYPIWGRLLVLVNHRRKDPSVLGIRIGLAT